MLQLGVHLPDSALVWEQLVLPAEEGEGEEGKGEEGEAGMTASPPILPQQAAVELVGRVALQKLGKALW